MTQRASMSAATAAKPLARPTQMPTPFQSRPNASQLPIPKPMVKKVIGETLDYLADNLKARAEQLAASS